MRNTTEITTAIRDAKDSWGVLTLQGLHQELNNMTPDDWRKASQIYTQQRSGPDGFHIEDSSKGIVTIHNDLRPLEAAANVDPGKATMNDVKSNLAYAVGALGLGSGVITGASIFGASLFDVAAMPLAVPIATAAVIVGGFGAMTTYYDYQDKEAKQGQAQATLNFDRQQSVLTVDTNAKLANKSGGSN